GRGLLSPIGGVNALAENILKIIRNPELAIEMRRKSLEFVKKFYSLERLQNDMKNIYKEL
ncbi:MAG: N-acetyl-alpha-D-glucosaminyl L-malate synthase BshA, partial [Flavobacteriaceae bacterium CG_4_9_14_3_um_filter_33_16]